MSTYCIYVAKSARGNLRIGLDGEIWGFDKRNKAGDLTAGDQVVFLFAKEGSPRVATAEEFEGRAERLVVAEVTEVFESSDEVWPDGEYPHRFRFIVRSDREDLDFGVEHQPLGIVEGCRLSANAGGRAVHSSDSYPDGRAEKPLKTGRAGDAAGRFLETMRTYLEDGVVFQSPARGQRYRVESVDDTGADIGRIDSNEPARTTSALYVQKLDELRRASGREPIDQKVMTVAARWTLLQGPDVSWSADRAEVVDVSDLQVAARNLIELLKALRVSSDGGEERLYKPALLDCVIRGIESGELSQNRIDFDWVAPRLIERLRELGQEATEQQAAYAFFHLTGDLFWMLCYEDPSRPLEEVPSPQRIRERVSHARLKEPFWDVLQGREHRARVTGALAGRFFGADRGEICLIGTSRDYVSIAEEIEKTIAEKGGWASWWSFIIRDEEPEDLRTPFWLYINAGDKRIAARMRVEEFRSVPGEHGIESPWPDLTFDDVRGKTRAGSAKSEIFKTWFRVSKVEGLDPPMSPDDFTPVPPSNESSLIHRSAFGYARLKREVAGESVPVRSGDVGMKWLKEATLWPESRLRELVAAIRDRGQVILAGPPGTGKTWVAKHVAKYLAEGRDECVRVVQFHPSYGYEEFVQGLRPVAVDGAIRFDVVNGVVLEMAKAARASDGDFVLVIDEMNRANLPRVFGELMYLLEYRDGEGRGINLQYSTDFKLPGNLRFIGTMNTADRSIRSIDVALRRRFEVFECPHDPEILESYYEVKGRENMVPGLIGGFRKLNARLTDQLDRHHAIGQTFFMLERLTRSDLRNVWTRQLQPLIEEYFFDQPDIAAQFTMEDFWPEAKSEEGPSEA